MGERRASIGLRQPLVKQTDTKYSTGAQFDSNTTTEAGNKVTGDYSRGENGGSSGTLWSNDVNQSQITSISQNETDATSGSENGNSIAGSKSGMSTDTSTVSLYPAETNMGDLVGPPHLSITASETDTHRDSTTFSGNDITGDTSASSHDVDIRTSKSR